MEYHGDIYGKSMIMTGWWLNPTPLKNMSSSVGMMKLPISGKKMVMFQSTNQHNSGKTAFILEKSTVDG